MIVLFSLCLVLIWLIFYRNKKIDGFIVDLSILLLLIFIFSSVALVITDIQYFIEGLRGPLRPIRALITLLGCYLLCRFYLEEYGENKIKEIAINYNDTPIKVPENAMVISSAGYLERLNCQRTVKSQALIMTVIGKQCLLKEELSSFLVSPGLFANENPIRIYQ